MNLIKRIPNTKYSVAFLLFLLEILACNQCCSFHLLFILFSLKKLVTKYNRLQNTGITKFGHLVIQRQTPLQPNQSAETTS